jgi:YHS domain-containing protein
MAMHTDPVCQMQVDEKQAAAQAQHQGQTYYFCSQGCKAKFEQNPQQYIQSGQSPSGGRAAADES